MEINLRFLNLSLEDVSLKYQVTPIFAMGTYNNTIVEALEEEIQFCLRSYREGVSLKFAFSL